MVSRKRAKNTDLYGFELVWLVNGVEEHPVTAVFRGCVFLDLFLGGLELLCCRIKLVL